MSITGPDGATTGEVPLSALLSASAVVVDDLAYKAAQFVVENQKASTSQLQRKLAIGYNRAARLMETLEALSIVSPPDFIGKREVLAKEVPADLKKASAAAATIAAGKTPMKSTPADDAVLDNTYRVSAEELRQFIERIERLDAEKKDLAEQQKEVMAEAKGRGYDTKVIRKVIALRKREPDDIAEEEAVLEMYKEALGMS